MKNTGEALRVARLAVEKAQEIQGGRGRDNALANSLLRLGHAYRDAGDHARALECYDRAVGIYESLGLGVYDLEAHEGKLLTYEATGDDEAAAREVDALLGRLEEYRKTMREVQSRDGFFDASHRVYDAAVDFAYTRRHDPRAAFDLAERSHARSLLDMMRTGAEAVDDAGGRDVRPSRATGALTLDEIRARMPERAQILQYRVLKDKTLVWLVSRDGFESRVVSVKADELAARVKGYLELVWSADDGGALAAEAKALYGLLVGPVAGSLDPGRQVCVVADKSLHSLPFTSLVSPATGRYLAEEYTLLRAPGASVFVEKSEAAAGRAGAGAETVLAVGDPYFDREKYRELAPLPSSGREASEVAALYGARPLLGWRAGEEEVARAIGGAEVVELASHYVID
jgi:tetratricopeptide (TPR) repeat protein